MIFFILGLGTTADVCVSNLSNQTRSESFNDSESQQLADGDYSFLAFKV